jgi:hypothetical protein
MRKADENLEMMDKGQVHSKFGASHGCEEVRNQAKIFKISPGQQILVFQRRDPIFLLCQHPALIA